jgi:hypothetical protein
MCDLLAATLPNRLYPAIAAAIAAAIASYLNHWPLLNGSNCKLCPQLRKWKQQVVSLPLTNDTWTSQRLGAAVFPNLPTSSLQYSLALCCQQVPTKAQAFFACVTTTQCQGV